jgi:hypothetical protein
MWHFEAGQELGVGSPLPALCSFALCSMRVMPCDALKQEGDHPTHYLLDAVEVIGVPVLRRLLYGRIVQFVSKGRLGGYYRGLERGGRVVCLEPSQELLREHFGQNESASLIRVLPILCHVTCVPQPPPGDGAFEVPTDV